MKIDFKKSFSTDSTHKVLTMNVFDQPMMTKRLLIKAPVEKLKN
jgi:hypothetical protein